MYPSWDINIPSNKILSNLKKKTVVSFCGRCTHLILTIHFSPTVFLRDFYLNWESETTILDYLSVSTSQKWKRYVLFCAYLFTLVWQRNVYNLTFELKTPSRFHSIALRMASSVLSLPPLSTISPRLYPWRRKSNKLSVSSPPRCHNKPLRG